MCLLSSLYPYVATFDYPIGQFEVLMSNEMNSVRVKEDGKRVKVTEDGIFVDTLPFCGVAYVCVVGPGIGVKSLAKQYPFLLRKSANGQMTASLCRYVRQTQY
jgi:hypothetical protein